MNTYKDYSGVLPAQETGKEITAFAEKICESTAGATALYNIAKARLLSVNNWQKTSGVISAIFRVCDKVGNPVERNATEGEYVRIDIPGPGSAAGHGYDWAIVEKIAEQSDATNDIETIGIRVRPASNPATDDPTIAHFYSAETTGNFILTREQSKVTMLIADRNALPNTEPDSLIDKIRDSTVGAAAIAAFSKLQWQKLADGILKTKPERGHTE